MSSVYKLSGFPNYLPLGFINGVLLPRDARDVIGECSVCKRFAREFAALTETISVTSDVHCSVLVGDGGKQRGNSSVGGVFEESG